MNRFSRQVRIARSIVVAALFIVATVLVLGAAVTRAQTKTATPSTAPAAGSAVRFTFVDAFIDSGAQGLAAYQFELKVLAGDVRIVGVERGDDAGFQDPPYYDPAALSQNRIIVGAFKTAGELPTGRTRVARLHVQVSGDVRPQYDVQVMVAGGKDGNPIAATASAVEGETR